MVWACARWMCHTKLTTLTWFSSWLKHTPYSLHVNAAHQTASKPLDRGIIHKSSLVCSPTYCIRWHQLPRLIDENSLVVEPHHWPVALWRRSDRRDILRSHLVEEWSACRASCLHGDNLASFIWHLHVVSFEWHLHNLDYFALASFKSSFC